MVIMVFGHGKIQATYDRHLPYWKKLSAPVYTFAPEDDPLAADDLILHGKSSFWGTAARDRLKWRLQWLVDSSHRQAVIFEYDSICLGKLSEMPDGFWGVAKTNGNIETFMAPRYATCPWIVDKQSAQAMLNVAARYDVLEEGADDRLLSAWAYLAGVPIFGHRPAGYSENDITPEFYPALRRSVEQDCLFVHGIKDAAALQLATGTMGGMRAGSATGC